MKDKIKLALSVLEDSKVEYDFQGILRAAAILEALLAELEPAEPVAWMSPGKETLEFARQDTVYGSHTIPLYLHPQPVIPKGYKLVRTSWIKDLITVTRMPNIEYVAVAHNTAVKNLQETPEYK